MSSSRELPLPLVLLLAHLLELQHAQLAEIHGLSPPARLARRPAGELHQLLIREARKALISGPREKLDGG
jgi:hypothetical protein